MNDLRDLPVFSTYSCFLSDGNLTHFLLSIPIKVISKIVFFLSYFRVKPFSLPTSFQS